MRKFHVLKRVLTTLVGILNPQDQNPAATQLVAHTMSERRTAHPSLSHSLCCLRVVSLARVSIAHVSLARVSLARVLLARVSIAHPSACAVRSVYPVMMASAGSVSIYMHGVCVVSSAAHVSLGRQETRT